MRVSAINFVSKQNSTQMNLKRNYVKSSQPIVQQSDNVSFNGKGGKFLGGLLGGAAGGAVGGAIIGGGSLAGLAAVTALGPIGWGLAAIYTIGGAITGGYLGSSLGDVASGEDKKDSH